MTTERSRVGLLGFATDFIDGLVLPVVGGGGSDLPSDHALARPLRGMRGKRGSPRVSCCLAGSGSGFCGMAFCVSAPHLRVTFTLGSLMP